MPSASPAVAQKQFLNKADQPRFPSTTRVPSPTRARPTLDVNLEECVCCLSIAASPGQFPWLYLLVEREAARSTKRTSILEEQASCYRMLVLFSLRSYFGPKRKNTRLFRSLRLSLGSEFLFCQFRAKLLFLLGNVLFVAVRIDERIRTFPFY